MIICWDLDGTITKTDTAWQPEYWRTREINLDTLFAMKLAKQKGHKNIIHTSRLTSEAKISTIQWLELNEVPYDGIFFDKPFYDKVVDDKMSTVKEIVKELMR